MDVSIELIFFFVFFAPMGILVALNLLLHRALPDIAAPWARLAASVGEPRPEPGREAPAPAPVDGAKVSNDEEALEAA
jgi:hypothetical protein